MKNSQADKNYILADAQAAAQEHPESFFVPDPKALEGVAPGDYVKLTFMSDESPSERMWVEVGLRHEAKMIGQLRNQPLFHGYGRFGDVVSFETRHILDVQKAGAVRFAK